MKRQISFSMPLRNLSATEDLEMDELMVGHSYFMASSAEELRLKLDYEIIPLIKEYEKDGLLQPSDELKDKINEWESLLD